MPEDRVITFLCAVNPKDLKVALGNSAADLPIVPTVDGDLKTCMVTYFNDLGPSADEVELPPGYSIASDSVDKKLASKLGLPLLTDLVGEPDDGGNFLEMGEDLTARISSVLNSYTERQVLMDFLANASDAEATEFDITLDTIHHPSTENRKLLTTSLKELCNQPSLILHNNSIFKHSDWEGICGIGSGSRKESVGGKLKIGRFGLGALSMFYFTEVLLISTV
jgi:hypothetical protein